MRVWDEVVGQEPAFAMFDRAVTDPSAMTHAWLITGPPDQADPSRLRRLRLHFWARTTVAATAESAVPLSRAHADFDVIDTEGLTLKVDLARELVRLAARRPAVGGQVILIQHAERLHEQAAEAMLESLEAGDGVTCAMSRRRNAGDVLRPRPRWGTG